jgi:uncharacterized protein
MMSIGAGFFVAGLVKGATGLGYSTSALPLLTLAIGLHSAMPLVLIPSLASNITIMAAAGHFGETVRRFLPLYVALIPGLAAGLALLVRIDQDSAAGMLGLVIAFYSVFALWQPGLVMSSRLERPLRIPVGLCNGLVNGLTGSQIMPLVPYMLSLKLDPDRFVQAVNIGFTLSSLIMIFGLGQIGLLGRASLFISIGGIVPAIVGGWLGGALRRRLPEMRFRRLVLGVLLALGLILITRLFDR